MSLDLTSIEPFSDGEPMVFNRRFRPAVNSGIEVINWFLENEQELERVMMLPDDQQEAPVRTWFYAAIRASEDAGDERWRYNWTELDNEIPTDFGVWPTKEGGRRSPQLPQAFNICEFPVDDPNLHGSGHQRNFPTGFELAPIPSGTIVRMYSVKGSDGETQYEFERPNQPQGECPLIG